MWVRTRSDIAPVWKAVEDDFVMGACAHRIAGFASRGRGMMWSAFDDESELIGVYPQLQDAKAAIWSAHGETHARQCTAPHARVWADLSGKVRTLQR